MSIGFTVQLRTGRDDGEPAPRRGDTSPSGEPMLELRTATRPQHFGDRPHREEIIGAMVKCGYAVPTATSTDQQIETDGEGNVSRVRTTSPRPDAAELYVCAQVWSRWTEATKNASFTLDHSISYRQFFAMCLGGIKTRPGSRALIEAALQSADSLRQFAGELLWQLWCQDNDPRAHLLRALVREELAAYRRAR